MSKTPVITIKKKHLWMYAVCAVVIVGVVIGISKRDGGKAANADGQASAKIDFADAVGKEAPDFTLDNVDGQAVHLRDLRGKTVVLFFNEGSMCYPACWNQVKELSADGRLNSADVASYSIVTETADSWKQIMRKRPEYQTSALLFDTNRKVSGLYDVLALTSSMHKGAYPGHTYVVIDKGGIIRYVLDDPSMAIRNDQIFGETQKL